MNKPICYVGVDVGKAELWVAVVDRRPRRFAHTATGVRSLVRFCRKAAPGSCVARLYGSHRRVRPVTGGAASGGRGRPGGEYR